MLSLCRLSTNLVRHLSTQLVKKKPSHRLTSLFTQQVRSRAHPKLPLSNRQIRCITNKKNTTPLLSKKFLVIAGMITSTIAL